MDVLTTTVSAMHVLYSVISAVAIAASYVSSWERKQFLICMHMSLQCSRKKLIMCANTSA